jgi:hypothetical protein
MSDVVIPSERSDRGISSNTHYKTADGRSLTFARDDTPSRAVTILSLAASPTFALMALLTSLHGAVPADMLCASTHASRITGMTTMYLLMSVFHTTPWLKLLRTRADRMR